jgi:CheY-like chemotaxis protein
VDLSEVIANIDRMLRRLIGENIKLSTLPEPEMDLIEADPCQIEQVIMNLTVNARDAMPTGGDITISSSMIQVVPGEEESMGLKPGRYAVISVADNGAGMSEEVKARIFEAFFTTKPLGKGTGLGLATCMSIVQQWNGKIFVDSTLGKGTTFRVFLPCLAGAVRVERAVASQAGEPTRGVETVLLVEDDPGLLQLTASVLERQGYQVLRATNGREGLGIVHEQEAKSVDVVVTDMVMPEMGGRMMADWLHALNPSLKILFTSGYTDLGSGGVIEAGLDFIHKPYTPTAMLRKIREILDRPAEASAPASDEALDAA